jgi:RNA polymerase sigma-70 factor (ECF subfamily)
LAIDVQAYYERYGPMVIRRCKRLLGNDARAEDAMHDVFVEVLRRQAELDDQAPSSLLYRIATNVCLNRLRSERRRPETPAGELLADIAAAPESEAGLVRALLGQLFGGSAESTRTIAVLHLVDGMTLEETAHAVGMSVSGVRKRLRGLKAHVARLEEVP